MKKNSPVNNNNGYTMLIALFICVLISVIGFSLLTTAANTNKITDNERIDQAIFYIAEAGLTQTTSALDQLVDEAYNSAKMAYDSQPDKSKDIKILTDKFRDKIEPLFNSYQGHIYNNYETIFNMSPSSKVMVNTIVSTPDVGYYEYEIISTGKIDTKTRKVKQKIILNLGLGGGTGTSGGATLFITPDKEVQNNSKDINVQIAVKGGYSSVKDNMKQKEKFVDLNEIGNKNIYDDLVSEFNSSIKACKNEIDSAKNILDNISTEIEKVTYGTSIDINKNGVIPLQNNTKINNFNATDVTFDIGNNDITLYMGNGNINNPTNIKVNGTGKIRIIANGLSLGNKLNVQRLNNSAKLDFVVKSMNMNAGMYVDGTFYSLMDNFNVSGPITIIENVYMKNSGEFKSDVDILGDFYTLKGNFDMNGDSTFHKNVYVDINNIYIKNTTKINGNLCTIVTSDWHTNGTLSVNGHFISDNSPKITQNIEIKINGQGNLNVGRLLAPNHLLFNNNNILIKQDSLAGGIKFNGGSSINSGGGDSGGSKDNLFTKSSMIETD